MNASPAARTDAEWERVCARRLLRRRRFVWGRRAVNVFLLWHCFALFIWLVPGSWPIVSVFAPPDRAGLVRPYLMATGFQQTWQMFSPNPDNADIYMTAQVFYRDGTQRTLKFPRMSEQGFVQRYQTERWRKLIELAHYDMTLWPDLADYAARTLPHGPQNPPVFVTLTRHVRPVPPPGQAWTPYTNQLFYRARVAQER